MDIPVLPSVTSSEGSKPQCKFFVARKKRYCRIIPRDGEDYCGEHIKPTAQTDGNSRIPCPLDNKHTCYASKLEKHLKICNARKVSVPEFIEEDINSGNDEKKDASEHHRLLSTYASYEIKDVIDKVSKIFKEHVCGDITDKILKHQLLEREMQSEIYGKKTQKHLKQVSSILGLLDEYGLLKSNTCFVEFGAGRGQLSFWIANACEELENISLLIIEKASPKHKHDNKLDKSTEQIQRIRADIANLVLDKVDLVNKCSNIVGVTKHLCGGATDLALRCLTNINENKQKGAGFVMTFCCHHRCRWAPYVGKNFFEAIGLGEKDFNIMCGMVSWATCGTGFSRERRINMGEMEMTSELGTARENDIGLSREEKEEIGWWCKSLINWGRLVHLESRGFHCKLHYYVDATVSPENVCIVGKRKLDGSVINII